MQYLVLLSAAFLNIYTIIEHNCNIITKSFQDFFLVKSTYFYDTRLSLTGKKPFPQKYCDDDKKASSLFQVARL